MRMMIKKLLKKHKYPPEGMEDAVQTVMLQCELWTDNNDYIWNARLDEAQAGIKIAGRNIHNLRYADDTTLMGESEELKSL